MPVARDRFGRGAGAVRPDGVRWCSVKLLLGSAKLGALPLL